MTNFTPPPINKTNKPKNILILGAGIAGLVAGYELTKAGHRVTILEAKMRAGGRIETLRSPFADDLYVETGAARIPDNHFWTLHYINHFGLETSPFYPQTQDYVHYCQGKRIRVEDEKKIKLGDYPLDFSDQEKVTLLADTWQKVFSPLLKDIGDPSLLDWPNNELKKYDRMTVGEYLNSCDISDNVARMFGFGHMNFAQEQISMLEILRLTAFGLRENQKVKIVGGFDRLPLAFASELKKQIRYGCKVISLAQNDSQVDVFYEQGELKQKISSDYVICTIPFSVLRDIDITPAVSAPKSKAIKEMSYMSASRVFFQVRNRYWQEEGFNGFGLADYPTELWHATFDLSQTRGVLVAYTKGTASRNLTAMNENQRITHAQKQIESMLPGLSEHIEGAFSVSWDDNEFAKGAHSFLNAGEVTELLPYSAYPEGRIHFAGEHTSAWHGWIQGAIESGYRSATEIDALT